MLDAYDKARLDGFTGTRQEFEKHEFLLKGVDVTKSYATDTEQKMTTNQPSTTAAKALIDMIRGEQGPQGPQGERGEPGLDLYQLAVLSGFKGSFYQFMSSLKGENGDSIVGPMGPKGEQGPKGDKGERGADGRDGDIPNHQIEGGKVRFELPNGAWGEWVSVSTPTQTSQMGAGPLAIQKFYSGTSNFPTTGKTQILYFDTSVAPHTLYIWDGSQYQSVGGSGAAVTGVDSWIYYAAHWSTYPTSQGTIAAGEVFAYELNGTTRYRLVPSPYVPENDAFYGTFTAGVLGTLLVARTWADSVGGVSDHGLLTGLTDDDHPQYHNDARGDLRYSVLAHTHSAMTGASALVAGVAGFVPAPIAGDQGKYLKGDGTWGTVTAGAGTPLEIYSLNRVINATGQQAFTTQAAINLSNGALKLNTGGFAPTLATGQIVVSTTGNYQLNFVAYTDDAGGTASGLNVFLKLNGVTVAQSQATLTDGYTGNTSISTVQPLTGGDILTLTAASTDGETVNLPGYDLSLIQLGALAYTSTNVYTGATISTAGVTGGVPPAGAGEQGKFLTGDGTWQAQSAGVTAHVNLTGLTDDDHPQYYNEARGDARYAPLSHNHTGTYQPLDPVLTATTASFTLADETKLDGLANSVAMTGATAVLPGVSGLVPTPAAGDEAKVLTGAGTWVAQPTVITDHGALTGLTDDDHTQYHTDARGDARYSLLAHDHAATYQPLAAVLTNTTASFTTADETIIDNLATTYQPLSAVLTATTASFTTADETKLDGLANAVVMTGATSVAAGVSGLVPTPVAGDDARYLRGDGTWQVVSGGGGTSDHGALTGLADDDHTQYHNDARGDARYSLLAHDHAATYQPLAAVLTNTTASFTTADETKLDALAVMVGATSVANGVTGTVPAALAGEQDKYLKADGTWETIAAGNPLAVYSLTRKSNATGQQAISSTTAVAVNLSASTVNLNVGTFTPVLASGQITVGTAGNYQINVTAYIDDGGGTASGLNIFLSVNGTVVSQSLCTADATFSVNASINTVRALAAGAILTITASSTDGEALNLLGYDVSIVQLATSVTPIINSVAEYGSTTLTAVNEDVNVSAGSWVSRAGVSITLPSAGTYRVFWRASGEMADAGTVEVVMSGRLHNSTTVTDYVGSKAVIVGYDSPTAALSSRMGTGSGEAIVAINAANTIVLQTRMSALASSSAVILGDGNLRGTAYLSFEKIAGQLPSTGATVDTLTAGLTADQVTTANGVTIVLNSGVNGNIPLNTGTGFVTLTAGKTYEITASVAVQSNGANTQQSFLVADSAGTTALVPGASFGIWTGTANVPYSGGSTFIYTPVTNQSIRLYFVGGAGTVTFKANGTGAATSGGTLLTVRQIGSTNTIGGNTNVNDQSSAGYFDIGTIRHQWGTFTQGSSAMSITLPAAFANSNYVVTGNVQDVTSTTIVVGTTFSSKNTTSFTSLTNSWNGTAVNASASRVIGWIAIGQKP